MKLYRMVRGGRQVIKRRPEDHGIRGRDMLSIVDPATEHLGQCKIFERAFGTITRSNRGSGADKRFSRPSMIASQ